MDANVFESGVDADSSASNAVCKRAGSMDKFYEVSKLGQHRL